MSSGQRNYLGKRKRTPSQAAFERSMLSRPFKTPRRSSSGPLPLLRAPTRVGPYRGAGRVELKACDLSATPLSGVISTTPVFQLLNGVQSGSAFYNRIGNKITMKSLHLTGMIASNSAATPASVPEFLRIIVFYDKQCNGAAPVIGDILANYDNTGTATTTSVSGINMNNAERFIILMDNRVTITNNDSSLIQEGAINGCYNQEIHINRFINLRNLETIYKATSNPAVVGDIATGSLFLVIFGSVASGANPGYILYFNARLRYFDK